jgi:hypothetical protein
VFSHVNNFKKKNLTHDEVYQKNLAVLGAQSFVFNLLNSKMPREVTEGYLEALHSGYEGAEQGVGLPPVGAKFIRPGERSVSVVHVGC